MGVTISIFNQKGGVGKTSTAFHLAGTLSRLGRRVLLIDNDPQASLTQGFFGSRAVRAIGAGESVASLYHPTRMPLPEDLIRPTAFEGVAIVPGSPDHAHYNTLPRSQWDSLEAGIRDFIDELPDPDIVLIDNPPNLYLCGHAGLVASDFVLVPLQAEDFGAQGLEPVMQAVTDVQAGPNRTLRVMGYLLTMFDRRLGIHTTYEAVLRENFGELVFPCVMPDANDYKVAVSERKPISHYRPKSAAARATADVARELLSRGGVIETEGVAA